MGMGSGLMELLKRVTVFMLAGQVILHFLPSGGYEKYVKMVISIMILSQIAVPVLSLGGFDGKRVFEQAMAEYEAEMERIEAQVEGAGLEETDYAAVGLSEAAKEKLSACAGELGVAIRNVSYSEQEGKLILYVSEEAEKGEGMEPIRIEKIEVGEKETEPLPAGEEQERNGKLRQAFAGALELEEEQLEVIWDE